MYKAILHPSPSLCAPHKYYNIELTSPAGITVTFSSVRDTAKWMVKYGVTRNYSAAARGIYSIINYRNATYKGYTVRGINKHLMLPDDAAIIQKEVEHMSRYIIIKLNRDQPAGSPPTQDVTVMDVPDDALEDLFEAAGLVNEGCSDAGLTTEETIASVMEVLEE